MKNPVPVLLSLCLFATTVAFGQQPADQTPAAQPDATAPSTVKLLPGTIIPAELSKSVDAKKAKAGDPVEAKTSVDMLSNGTIVMPRNSKIIGHVTSAKPHSKDSPDSSIGIAFDRLVAKDGHEFPLQAAVQAIGAPINAFAADSGAPVSPSMAGGPIGGSGTGPGMGGGTSGGQRSGGTAPSSYPAAGMPSGPPTTGSSSNGALSRSAEGVVGIKDLALSATPEGSVFTSNKKNVHLDGGAQLLLRVQ